MSLLVPKFHPLILVAFAAFYILCLLDGSAPNLEFQYAIAPLLVAGALVAGSAAAGIYGAHKAAEGQEAAIAAQKAQDRRRRRDIKKALGPEAKRAKRRLKRGKYGLSRARQQETTEEIQRATEAQAKGQRAELERGQADSGRREAMKRALSETQGRTVAEGRLGTARMSGQLAQQQQAADRQTVAHYGATLGGLTSAAPQMQFQSTGFGERMAGIGQQALQAAAMMGVGSKAPGTAPAAKGATVGSQAASTDPDALKLPV